MSSQLRVTGFRTFLIVVIVTLSVAAPAAWLGYQSDSVDRRILSFELLQKNTQIANIVANQINEVVQSTFRVMEATARYPALQKKELRFMEPLLKTLIQKYRFFNALYLIDRDGRLTLNVTQAPEVFASRPSADFFTNIVKGKVSNYISRDVYISRAAMRPAVTMGVVIRGDLYALEAVLAAEVDLGYLMSLIKQYDVGSRGEVFVVDEQGKIVTHPRYTDLAGMSSFETLPEAVTVRIQGLDEKAAAGRLRPDGGAEGAFVYNDPAKGGQQFVSYVRIRKYNEFREQMPEWTVVVVQPAGEFMASVAWLWERKEQVMVGSLILGLATGFLVVWLAGLSRW